MQIKFPENATRKDKLFIKEIHIQNLQRAIELDEQGIKDCKQRISYASNQIKKYKCNLINLKRQVQETENLKVD